MLLTVAGDREDMVIRTDGRRSTTAMMAERKERNRKDWDRGVLVVETGGALILREV
jgi:hypothetical protein